MAFNTLLIKMAWEVGLLNNTNGCDNQPNPRRGPFSLI